jgi:hypothetical protein
VLPRSMFILKIPAGYIYDARKTLGGSQHEQGPIFFLHPVFHGLTEPQSTLQVRYYSCFANTRYSDLADI